MDRTRSDEWSQIPFYNFALVLRTELIRHLATDVSSVSTLSAEKKDEGLTLETLALEFHYDGQKRIIIIFRLSFCYYFEHTAINFKGWVEVQSLMLISSVRTVFQRKLCSKF